MGLDSAGGENTCLSVFHNVLLNIKDNTKTNEKIWPDEKIPEIMASY